MNNLRLYKYFKNLAFLALITIFLNSCGVNVFDRKDPIEPNARKRARQNVEEGRGFSAKGMFGGKGGTNFEFATSNPLWRATLDTLDFMVISSVDYAGGLIISDWYSDNSPDEAIKITVRFLANEVRVDSLKISVHKKTCVNSNCLVKKIDTDLTSNIRDKILKKAAVYVKTADDNKKRKKIKSAVTSDRY